jgi:hypothetical protein
LSGAIFRAVFAVDDQRYEALITYLQREAYLQYRFAQPEHLFFADRRRRKRFPFRPRENAYVIASDGGIPGLGVAGPLTNIGLGGLCLRVDRVLKLEDGLRIPPSTALFERGASFPRVRIQDLPKLPLLEVSGWVTHAEEHGSEILLGFQFGDLAEDQARLLGDCLTIREKMFQGHSGAGASAPASQPRAGTSSRKGESAEESPVPEDEHTDPHTLAFEPMRLLQRKTVRLMLIATNEALRTDFEQRLWRYGYHRLEIARSCEEARMQWEGSALPKPHLVLIDLAVAQVGDQEPLAAVRFVEKQMVVLGEVPTAIMCEDIDPTMLLSQAPGTRFLAGGQDEDRWIEALDTLLGFEAE